MFSSRKVSLTEAGASVGLLEPEESLGAASMLVPESGDDWLVPEDPLPQRVLSPQTMFWPSTVEDFVMPVASQ